MRPNLHNPEFKVYVITKGDVLRLLVVEIIISSVAYSIAMKFFHNFILASASSWAGPEGIKRLYDVRKMFGK